MRATIVVDDNRVIVDGIPAPVDCSELAAVGQHAVQWYDTWGEVEFKVVVNEVTKQQTRKANEIINDFSPYQRYVDAWQIKYDAMEAERLAELERMEKEQAAAVEKGKKHFEERVRAIVREMLDECGIKK